MKTQKNIRFVHFEHNERLDKSSVLPYYYTKRSVNMNKVVKSNLGNKEIFSRNLKRYLENSGKKQNEAAKFVGVSTGTFCDWMKGRSYPRMDKVQKLAEFFGIKKSDLVEDVNIAKESVSNKEQEVLDLFHKVPEEKREFVLSLIRATIDNL